MFVLRFLFAVLIVVSGLYLAVPFVASYYGAMIPEAVTANQPFQHLVLGCLLVFIGLVSILSVFLGLPRGVALPQSAFQFSELIKQLTANYDVLRKQLRLGFAVAAVSILLGTIVAMAGIAASFGLLDTLATESANPKDVGAVATLVGLVIDVIAGVGLYLFRVNFDRLNTVSDRLLTITHLQVLFDEADALKDEIARTEMTKEIIRRVLYGSAKTSHQRATNSTSGESRVSTTRTR